MPRFISRYNSSYQGTKLHIFEVSYWSRAVSKSCVLLHRPFLIQRFLFLLLPSRAFHDKYSSNILRSLFPGHNMLRTISPCEACRCVRTTEVIRCTPGPKSPRGTTPLSIPTYICTCRKGILHFEVWHQNIEAKWRRSLFLHVYVGFFNLFFF
jgi:hypothetical protein